MTLYSGKTFRVRFNQYGLKSAVSIDANTLGDCEKEFYRRFPKATLESIAELKPFVSASKSESYKGVSIE